MREAATTLRVSAGALSKAMSALEANVGQRLFVRSPRGLSLTEAGVYLRQRAHELLAVEDDIRQKLDLRGSPRRLALVGTEPLLAIHLATVLALANARFPALSIELRPTRDDGETRKTMGQEPASVAVVTEVSRAEPTRPLPAAGFGTFVGLLHPLARRARSGVAATEVITHAFVVPDRAIFGPMPEGSSADGWRDDVFPREKRLIAPTLALVQAYVEAGHAIAYLPVALASRMNAKRLEVTACDYSCSVEAHLVRARAAPGWVRQIV
jgi:DNA-binding transcriptional LysR family regulator